MKKTMKRLALILLAATMVMGLFAVMASAAPEDYPVSSSDTLMPFSINHKTTGSNTTLYYTVSLKIGNTIAEYAAIRKDIIEDVSVSYGLKMKSLRFACYLEDDVLKGLPSGSLPQLQNNNIFELVQTAKTQNGFKLVFKVKESVCERWHLENTVEEVKNELMNTNMYITGPVTIPTETLRTYCTTDSQGRSYFQSEGCLIIYSKNAAVDNSTMGANADIAQLGSGLLFKVLTDTSLSYANRAYVEEHYGPVGGASGSVAIAFYNPDGIFEGWWVDGLEPIGTYGYIPAPQPNVPDTYQLTPVPAMLNDAEHFTYIFGYDDGDVRPNKSITRAEVATIFYRLLNDSAREQYFSTANTFSDVAVGNWFNTAVSTMANAGIITGYPDGTFRPNAPITRAEFAAIIARFDGGITTGTVTFPDVYGHWAKAYIDRAAELGWINGYSDGTFRPNRNITRAETAAMINRVLNRAPQSSADLLSNMKVWPDNTNVSAWYYLDMQEATNSHTYDRKSNGFESWKQIVPNKTWVE